MTRWPLLIALVFLAGCESMEESAKKTFSHDNTCPLGRVETRVRKDLKLSMFQGNMTPPADVAADPGRLKMWQDQQAKNSSEDDDNWTITEARGCDKHVFYKCKLPQGGNGDPRYLCMSQSNVPKTISGWPDATAPK
ncbi:MAG: hypothetical protein ABI183_10870 [Polyangiaceae bacterium]